MTPGTVIRILIVDDNMLIRSATKLVLSICKDFRVVGEASDGATGVQMAVELEPDVVLMDINMQPVNGIKATRDLLSKKPKVLVIGFSALPHPHEEREMIRAGAAGVIHKNATRQMIVQNIRNIFQERLGQFK